ncbi:Ig-like domain-containing protein [Massilia sp. LjRoot122]|uniref:Ig-like domain-containing protein n=1 Tax=Massilia sp. LjRoot122 TaxID=3342257 RepID=UPI003ECE5001
MTHIDLNFATAMAKGNGSIFVTDGAVQTVIDRVTGQPTLRVVGASFTKLVSLDQVQVSGTHVIFDAAGLPPGAKLNVYMGAGTLLSGGQSVSALTVPGSAAFTTPAVVVEPPPVFGADIALDGASLKSGQDITATITFSKPVPHLDRAALSAGNAGIGELASNDDGTVWKVTLSGAAATNAPDNVLRLDMARVTAGDGSHGTGVEESPPYLVDTLVAAYIDPLIQMFEDTGPDDMDGISNDDTMGVGGILHGALKPDEFIELVINGKPIHASKVEIVGSTDEPGAYFWYYAGEEGEHFNIGENAVQARIVGLDGHSSLVAGKTIIVEQDAPDIVSKPGGVIDAAKAITISFDEAMYWTGHAESSGEIEIVDGFGNTSWIDMNESMLSEDGKTLTLTPAEHNLATGNSYSLTLPDSLTDLAGNGYAGPAIAFSTAGDYQDKAAPRLVQLYIANGSGIYGKGDVLDFRLRYTEKVKLDAGTVPELYLDNGKVAKYVGLTADGKEMIFNYTVEAGDDIDNLDYADPSWTLYGKVRDDAGNVFWQEHDEYEGLSTADGKVAKVAIDTVAATPGTPQLHASSEASAPGNGSTTDAQPRLTGGGAEAYATIAIYAGDIKVGSATADADGNWDTVLTTALSTGTHQLTVTQQDRAGNVSALSSALALTIAAPMPTSLAAPVMSASSDTGVSSSDGLTQLDQPGIAGKGPANTALTLKHNGAFLTNVTTDANGDWSYTLPSLADGVHGFSMHLGETVASPTLSITVDRTRPTVAASPDGDAHFNPNGDIVISFSEAVHIAAAEGDGDLLVLVDANGKQQKIALGDLTLSSDKRSLTIGADKHNLEALTDYRVQLPTTLTDLAGNAMSEYGIAFRTDNGALPSAVRVIVSGDHSYRAGDTISFRIRFNEQVEKSGASELSLGLSNGARAAFTGISGNEALFSYTVADGQDIAKLGISDTSMLVGRFADVSGNLLDSAHIEFTGLYSDSGYGNWLETTIGIDTKADKPGTPQLHAGSEASAPGTGTTTDTQPRLTGSGAEAYATIAIYAGDIKVGSATADADGNWDTVLTTALSTGTHQLTVTQQDRAGNVSALSSALALAIAAPMPTSLAAPVMSAASDTGISSSDGLTQLDQPGIAGKGPANTALTLKHNGAFLTKVTTDANGDWNYTLPSLADGVHGFSAHLGETLASPTLSITVDRTRPTVAASPDGDAHFNPNGDIVISFSEAVHIAAAEGDMLVLVDANGKQQKIALGDFTQSSDKRSLTIGADKHNLEALTDYRVQLPTTLTDLAGNAMSEYGIAFRTDNGVLPSAVRAIVSGDHRYRAGETISFRIRFNEQVEKSGASELSLGLSNGARAAFTGISGNEALFSYTVADGQDIAKLGISDTSMLVGRFADVSGNLLDSAHIEFSGLYDDSGYGSWIDIDTVAAAPDLPLLAPASNSGSTLDLVTKDKTPTLAGTTAEAHARIEIYEGTTLLGFGYADDDGDWEVAVEAGKELADGAHQLTVKQIDAAGNNSSASAPLSVTVDATAPAAPPELLLATASDTGASNSDGITSNPTPTFTGSRVLANADIALYVDGMEVGRTVSSEAGTWSIAIAPGKLTAEKSYSLTATQFDAAGNESPASSAFKLVLDSAALTTALTAPDLDATSDTGVSISDNITKDRTPTFNGSGALANSVVALIAGSTEVGRTIADASGNWSITSSTLADGIHEFRLRQFDLAGNQGPDSDPLSVTIDNVGPSLADLDGSLLGRRFNLSFNEAISFHPNGHFDLQGILLSDVYDANDKGNGWEIVDGKVLSFNISLNGFLKMQWTNGSVTDLAGNLAEITGMPEWTFTL